jgi:predicted PhzF superfamily epimerase YddE/YHI9
MSVQIEDIDAIEMLQIDAFCSGPFTGNPAAVVFDHYPVPWMQKLANENNLAETAFLRRMSDEEMASKVDEVNYSIRWFTPNKEVDLCGHATLASAHALYETRRVPRSQTIVFHTMTAGSLTCRMNPDGMISLDFPATPLSPATISDSDRALVLAAFAIADEELVYLGRTAYDVFAEITRSTFAKLDTVKDYGAISALGGRGLIITAIGGKHGPPIDSSTKRGVLINNHNYDFLSRCFFPL